MGNAQAVPDAHVRIYGNLLGIRSSNERSKIIQTILSSHEHLESAKNAGIYGHLLHYVQVTQAGGAAPNLPGERRTGGSGGSGGNQQVTVHMSKTSGKQIQASQKGNEKAITYFSACLRILELEEEVALNEEALKAAYKKAVVRAHPDKGGSEKEFEAVTRAYAYLGDILKRIQGGGKKVRMDAPPAIQSGQPQTKQTPTVPPPTATAKWDSIKPVNLNPEKLDINAFNKLFEQTRMPDPEEAGYGDWLKNEESNSSTPQFSGKFNRDVFNQAFAEDAKGKTKPRAAGSGVVVQEQILSNRLGYATELGRSGRGDYTAANDDCLQFTDLKKAYTEYNTFSHEVADVQVGERSFDQYTQARKEAPPPLADYEVAALAQAERQHQMAEEERQRRKTMETQQEQDYFQRMKRLVVGLPPPKD
jgi:curved DNA-binding protein CbpA